MTKLNLGLTGHAAWIVTPEMTAAQVGSGLVAAFSTPMLVALMESAAVDALAGSLEDYQTTVGTQIDVHHEAATPAGASVRAEARLTAIDGHQLVFEITAWDAFEVIGRANHQRFIVDKARFETRLAQKQSENPGTQDS